jgi:N-acylneuraminate cytidylyltransferase
MKIAVIPARGGSKRIPRKNIRDFCGNPIIYYSINQAKKSSLFDKIIVSTDDEEIAEVARSYGAETPFLRPAELSDDYSTTNAVVKHAIEWFQARGESLDLVCCIYATAPFVLSSYIKEGYEKLVSSKKSFAFTVTSYSFPIQRSIRINQCGEVEAIWPESINSRSQDLEEAYHDAGQFYWGTANAFLNDVVMFSTAALPVVLPRYRVQDIDTEEDWRRAELMYQALQSIVQTE